MLAAVAAGRDIVLEGPPGTSKSHAAAGDHRGVGIPLLFVEGNADLTPAQAASATTIRRGCCARTTARTTSCDGPLLEAMRTGGFLYVEEFNRAPEDTLNTLLTAMAERQIAVPRAGAVTARADVPGDRVDEPVRQRRHDTAVHLGPRPAVPAGGRLPGRRGRARHRRAARAAAARCLPSCGDRLVADAVAVTRATREQEDIRQGSSVRGRDRPHAGDGAAAGVGRHHRDGRPATSATATSVYDAMVVALSGRIFLDETVEATPEAGAAADLGGPLHPRPGRRPRPVEERSRPTRRSPPARPPGHAGLRPLRRQPKMLDEEPVLLDACHRRRRRSVRLAARDGRPAGRPRSPAAARPARPTSRARCAGADADDGRAPDRRRCAARGRSRPGWRCRGRGGTSARGAAPASWPASGTAAAPTRSTSTRRVDQLVEHPVPER